MGKTFSCLKRKTNPKREITLAILGLDNAGKTTTTKALLGEPLETAPTVGFSALDVGLEHYEIKIFDLGGGHKIRDIWKQYFVEVYGIIYVVDSTTPHRFGEAKSILQDLLEHEKIGGKPVLVLANKQDHDEALDEVEICEKLALEDLVNANKCPCRIETCSAIKGTGKKIDQNIKVGLKWICATLEHNWNVYHPRVEQDKKEEADRKQKEMLEKRERVKRIREEREKKEEEERQRMGIEKPVSDDDEDVLDGDPFKPVDIDALNEKELRMREERKKKKELELKMLGRDTNENNINHEVEDSDGEIKSSRSLKFLGLQNGLSNKDKLFYHNNLNSENKLHYDSDQESDSDITSRKKNRRLTPRLPPLQKPLGTKFSAEEIPAGKKKRKKKKLKALQENVEETDNYEDSFQPSNYSAHSVSKIVVKSQDSSHDFTNQNSYLNNLNPNKHIVVGKTLSLDNETEEDLTPRSLKKKKKKVKKHGHHQSFDEFPTPRSLEGSENADLNSSLSYHVNDEESGTEVRKLKKKTYVKKNQTSPSDDEIDMEETLRNSSIKDFSWTLSSPKKEVLSSDEEPVRRNWAFAEDLGDTMDTTPTRRIGVRPNYEDDDDVLL